MITLICPRCKVEYQAARHRMLCPACWYEHDREQKAQYYRQKQRALGRDIKEIDPARRQYTRVGTFIVISSPYPEYEGRVYVAAKMRALLETDDIPIGTRVIDEEGTVYEIAPEGEAGLKLRTVT